MPLAVMKAEWVSEPARCDACKQTKANCRKIDKRPMSPTVTLCMSCFWTVFPYGVIVVGPEPRLEKPE